jgi:hypothetical protein
MGQVEFMLDWKQIAPFLGDSFKRLAEAPTASDLPS